MKKLRYLGQQVYQGHDKGVFIKVLPGAVVEVSEDKADRLMADFPGEWEDAKDAPAAAGDVPKPAAPGAGKVPVANKAAVAKGHKASKK